ncbi:MAG: T3SS effector NleG family protein [Rickettsiaceae bacterium]|nr:T3SS effector NleG family protein [Rickettsiaceae bacterium]
MTKQPKRKNVYSASAVHKAKANQLKGEKLDNEHKSVNRLIKKIKLYDYADIEFIDKLVNNFYKYHKFVTCESRDKIINAILKKFSRDHINHQDETGATFLMHLLAHKQKHLVKIFLEAGANFKIKDYAGNNTFDYISSNKIRKIFDNFFVKDRVMSASIDELSCPIVLDLTKEPVFFRPKGSTAMITYDKQSIKHYLSKKKEDPITREYLSNKLLICSKNLTDIYIDRAKNLGVKLNDTNEFENNSLDLNGSSDAPQDFWGEF